MAALGILLPITVVIRAQLGWRVPSGETILSILDISMLTAGTLAMLVFYSRALMTSLPQRSWHRLLDIPVALCLGAGLSLGNAWEVLRGFVSMNSEFVRTPKKGDIDPSKPSVSYRANSTTVLLGLEIVFVTYYLSAIVYALAHQLWAAIPFLLLYLIGFLFMSIGTISESEFKIFRRKGFSQARPRAGHL
jgi:hypothetical protein